VSWGGQPLNHEPLQELAAEHNLPLIEDAACSHGAAYDETPVGSQFDASIFSFHPRKPLATGEGGLITTDDDEIAQAIRTIKNFGIDQDAGEFVRRDATNARFSDVLAAIGVAQLEKLDEIVERRRELAARYTELLADIEGVDTPMEIEDGRHNYQSYCIYIETGDDQLRDTLIDRLAERDIETQIGTYALHQTKAFADTRRVGNLETSQALHHNLLTLPVAQSMDVEDQHRVVGALEEELAEVIT
jgi:dTDP-4-amino-4,6-dideoxygalactose transaminase